MFIKNLLLVFAVSFSSSILVADCANTLATLALQTETRNHLVNSGYDPGVAARIVAHADQKIINQIVSSDYLIPAYIFLAIF